MRDLGRDLLEQLKPFPRQAVIELVETDGVAARPRQWTGKLVLEGLIAAFQAPAVYFPARGNLNGDILRGQFWSWRQCASWRTSTTIRLCPAPGDEESGGEVFLAAMTAKPN